MLIKIFDKALRELYRLFHPVLWGKNIQINGIPRIYDSRNLRIGRNVSINSGCVLQCYGGLVIGDNVTISDGAKILTRQLKTNNYSNNSQRSEREHEDKEVVIGNGTWIATNAMVLPGIHIADNCIIAAGAVVANSIENASCLYGGVPAKVLKEID